MNTQQSAKSNCWLTSLGHTELVGIDLTQKATGQMAKRNTQKPVPRIKDRFYLNKQKRAELKTTVAVMLMILAVKKTRLEMYNELLAKGLLTDHKYATCEFSSFEALVSEVLNQIHPDRKLLKQTVAELFDQGKTRPEIEKILNAKSGCVYQMLVRTGRITPNKRNRKD